MTAGGRGACASSTRSRASCSSTTGTPTGPGCRCAPCGLGRRSGRTTLRGSLSVARRRRGPRRRHAHSCLPTSAREEAHSAVSNRLPPFCRIRLPRPPARCSEDAAQYRLPALMWASSSRRRRRGRRAARASRGPARSAATWAADSQTTTWGCARSRRRDQLRSSWGRDESSGGGGGGACGSGEIWGEMGRDESSGG